MITEPKKVRCTGCGIVILLTPNEESETGLTASFPEQPVKPNAMSDSRKRIIMASVLGVMAVVLLVGLWWSFRAPSDRGAIDGEISLDGGPLEKGIIEFTSPDSKQIIARGPIVRGRYSISASHGPSIGRNDVSITGDEGTTIAQRYNTKSQLRVVIKAGSNTENFDVKSK